MSKSGPSCNFIVLLGFHTHICILHVLRQCFKIQLLEYEYAEKMSRRLIPKVNHSFFFFFLLFRAAPEAYRSSQARGLIGATAAGHSHSHTGSEPCLQPTPQLTATLDP